MFSISNWAHWRPKKLNEAENEKLYLRRNPDTTSYFATQYDVFAYTLRADSLLRAQQADKKSANSGLPALMLRCWDAYIPIWPRLRAISSVKRSGVRLRASPKMTLEAQKAPLFKQRPPALPEALQMQNAADYLYAGYASGNFDEAPRYAELALRDSAHRSTVLHTLALNYEAARKPDELLAFLQRGVHEYPNDDFFFNKLAEEYFRRNRDRELPGLCGFAPAVAHQKKPRFMMRRPKLRSNAQGYVVLTSGTEFAKSRS